MAQVMVLLLLPGAFVGAAVLAAVIVGTLFIGKLREAVEDGKTYGE